VRRTAGSRQRPLRDDQPAVLRSAAN